jgi:small-conductance mechanosensitive channel
MPTELVSSGRRRLGLIALLLALGIAASAPTWAAAQVADLSAPASEPEPGGLFSREAPGYDAQTVVRLRDLVVASTQDAPAILQRMLGRGRQTGFVGSALLLSLVLAVLVTLAFYRRLPERAERAAVLAAKGMPATLASWMAAVAQVGVATAPPLVLWSVHQFLQRLTGFDGPGYRIVGIFLLAWTYYALVATTIRELVLRPLLPIPAEHGRYLYGIARWLALYGLVLTASIDAASVLGVPGDVVALIEALLDLSLILLLTASLARKSAVMALFPKLPNRFYRGFVRGFGAAYPLIVALGSGTLLLALGGYRQLAYALWLRSWAVAGTFLAVVCGLHVLHQIAHRLVVGSGPATAESGRLYASASRVLDLAGALIFVGVALRLTGLRDPLVDLLSLPIYSFENRQLSLLLLCEGVFMVGAFALAARLVRDFLNYQVYPALAVDTGVAKAIDVFISYAIVIVGILFALEFIGVGVGVLTVFAGAVGIGLGFGLQPIANNLTSGLTLVFGRGLRRGDWVAHGGTVGMVEEIGMRATHIRTGDAVDYLVPNSEFVSGTIVNWTRSSPFVREHVPVTVAYGSDPDYVRAVLLRVAAASPGVEADPPPEVWFIGFGDNSLDFELLVWVNVKATAKAPLRSDLYFAVFRAFKDAGIDIPFPQRDLHLRSVSPQSMQALSTLANGAEAGEDPAATGAGNVPRVQRRA